MLSIANNPNDIKEVTYKMFNPIVDMALVNKIMGMEPNDTPPVTNKKVNHSPNDTPQVPLKAVGFNPNGGSSIVDREFLRDAKKHGVHVDKNGNYIIYKYGSYRRTMIILGIIIVFLQLCILGNL